MGVPVRLIDRREAPATTSRAIGVQARTLELFHQRGLADEMVRLGNKGRFGSVYGGGKRVFHLDFAQVESPYPITCCSSRRRRPNASSARPAHGRASRPSGTTELVSLLGRMPCRTIRRPSKAVLKHGPMAASKRSQAPWLISAEGAHSSRPHDARSPVRRPDARRAGTLSATSASTATSPTRTSTSSRPSTASWGCSPWATTTSA